MQWLERQSLLRAAPGMATVVSGSSLAWNAPSTTSDMDTLLGRASFWFAFNPWQATWGGNLSSLAAATRYHLPDRLAELGIQGIFLAPTTESWAGWNPETGIGNPDSLSFAFAREVGSHAEYAALEKMAVDRNIWLGGDMLPPVTGVGPDFSLALRGVRDYPGMFILVDAPSSVWNLLPLNRINDGSLGRPLPSSVVLSLAQQGVIPPAFSRDHDPFAMAGGWASTQEMVGIDGVSRRWLYRYVESPLRPVLNWDDPSGAARRVLSASVIQQVGVLHQALVCISIEPLWGQDPALPEGHLPEEAAEPALSALQTLSREIRRYGSWSLLRDAYPARQIPQLQAAGVDFVPDTITSPALEYAMLSGNARPLTQALQSSLEQNVDHSRLWRTAADGEGIRFGLASLSGMEALRKFSGLDPWRSVLVLDNNILFATAASLAAMADGLGLEETRQAALSPMGNEDVLGRIQRGHILQIAFRAMLPGLMMISGRDLDGMLFAAASGEFVPSSAAWSLDGARLPMTRQGMPLGLGAYLSLAAQQNTSGSFASEMRRLADIRLASGVARGRVTAVADMDDMAATGVLTALPDGDYLFLAGNFSGRSILAKAHIPPGPDTTGTDWISGDTIEIQDNSILLHMQPWQYRLVHIRAAHP